MAVLFLNVTCCGQQSQHAGHACVINIARDVYRRKTRTLPDQIKELKAELPKPDSEGNRPSNPELEREIAALEQVGLQAKLVVVCGGVDRRGIRDM